MLRRPFHHVLERALLARFDGGVALVTTHSEPMVAASPVVALVARRKLAIAQNLVRLRLQLRREHGVDLAALDEQRHVRLRVPLDVGGNLEERGVGDRGGLDDAVECEVEDVAGCGGMRASVGERG